ncbi:MAG: orotate phosphoribosyltransferase [Armatimonadota bacterium]
MDDLYKRIFEAGCIKFGEFKLKSGIISPVYVDFRVLISKPDLLRDIGWALANRAKQIGCDRIAGIPYAGIPLAVATSLASSIPAIYVRKEAKHHGTGKLIEGEFKAGERVLVIDDVVTDGASKIETIELLREAGLVVTDVLVVLDREQGGARILERAGYRLHALCTLSRAISLLVEAGLIGQEVLKSVEDFLAANQFS